MSALTTVTIVCDHLGCEEAVEAKDAATARRHARRAGWHVGQKKHHTFHDYCPVHREEISLYAARW